MISTRREFLTAVAGAALTQSGCSRAAASGEIISPENFGAKGDGAADDFGAFTALIAHVNRLRGGTIRLGRGKTYRLGRYVTRANRLPNPAFANCNSLTIEGNGAKIDIRGDFDRDAQTTYALSILFENCSNLVIRDLEIDGNVDRSTNSSRAAEAGATGLHLRGCFDVLIENVHSHHHQRDGLLIRDTSAAPFIVSKRITVRNSRFLYNARQGVSITGARGCLFENCDFSWTARAAGAYGGHLPRAGVDIEPPRDINSAATNATDANTGDITFLNCRFEENVGAGISCGTGQEQDNVRVLSCTLRVGSSGANNVAVVGGPGCVVRDCTIDLGTDDANFYVWPTPDNQAGDVLITGNRFTGAGRFIRTNRHGGKPVSGRVLVESNVFNATGAAPYSGFLWDIARGTATNVQFRDNAIFVPKEMYVDGGPGDFDSIFRMSSGVTLSEGNRFSTDLPAGAGSSGTAHYCQSYDAATLVRNETFTGTAPGPADTFRPAAGSRFDTTRIFPGNGG